MQYEITIQSDPIRVTELKVNGFKVEPNGWLDIRDIVDSGIRYKGVGTMKIGDYLECIDNKWSTDTLRVGEVYKLVAVKTRDDGHIDFDVEEPTFGDILKNEPSAYFELSLRLINTDKNIKQHCSGGLI